MGAQDDLAIEVAALAGVQVERAEMERALQKPEETAWNAYMRAVAHYGRATRSGYEAAVAEARRALEIDPNYSLVHGVLLVAQGMLLVYRGDDDSEAAKELVDSIRRARVVAPDDSSVLAGCVGAFSCLRKPLDGLPFAERLVAIYPNLDWAHGTLGDVLVQLGRSDEGLAELAIAERLAPNSIRNHADAVWRSVAHLQAGRIDQALDAAGLAMRLLVSPESLVQNVPCLAMANDWDRAGDAMRRLRLVDQDLSRSHVENLVRYFHCGSSRVGDYVAIVAKLWDEMQGGPS